MMIDEMASSEDVKVKRNDLKDRSEFIETNQVVIHRSSVEKKGKKRDFSSILSDGNPSDLIKNNEVMIHASKENQKSNPNNTMPNNTNKRVSSSDNNNNNNNAIDNNINANMVNACVEEKKSKKRARVSSSVPSEFMMELEKMDSLPTIASSWPREPLAPIDPKTYTFAFQWLDIAMYEGKPLVPSDSGYSLTSVSSSTSEPVIRLTGVTEEGHSVMLHVHGVVPYFYAACPLDFNPNDCETVRNALQHLLKNERNGVPVVLRVELIHGYSTLYGYHFDSTITVLKIYMAMPNYVSKARQIFENGFEIPGYGSRSYVTYESNVPFVLRYMIDNDISGCNWLEIPKGTYLLRSEGMKSSLCQLEVDILHNSVISHAPEGKWSKIAPFRILSFDIECMGRKGQFPEANQDPIIQIGNIVTEQGSSKPKIRNVFVLGTCKSIVGAHVMEFEKEGDLLEAWAEFVRQIDPDIMTGYNIDNFDVPYIMDRGHALHLKNYHIWGRLKNVPNQTEKKVFSSSQYGKSEYTKATVPGRCMFDLLPIIRRSQQLSSYSLNSVSSIFLGQQKEDVPHGIISDLHQGSASDRHRLAVYCLKDAYLPQRLLDKLCLLVNSIEMARVTGVPLDFLVDRGQQIKVFSMLLRKCKQARLLVPHLPRKPDGDSTYEGATVIEPKRAYYTLPIVTLDFASLYPSIMQAYNLCFSTLVASSDIVKLDPKSYTKSPSGDVFVTSATKKGILPMILEELLAARKRAKEDMKNSTDPMEKAVQNGRQLALKVSANSVYGFTGANVGQLPCIPIASSVTAYGRDLLFQTRKEVEEKFTMKNGYLHDAQVIYGDTDSVMIKFGVETVQDCIPLATEAAQVVSSIFPSPIQLEFEKVYFPYLLMNKKRYAGLLWTNPTAYDKLDSKGLETVRRDNCLLVRRMVETCLRKILIDRDVDAALEYTRGIISDLLQNKIDISLLVITKGLNKTADSEQYKAKQAHTELAMRMKKRDPGSAPNIGERVAYVIVEKGKNTPLYEKSEDPVYALENSTPIDCDYYLKNQLQNPLERIFEPIIGLDKVKSTIFHGEHTRKISKPILNRNSGGMLNFAVKSYKCLGCKAPLRDKHNATVLCNSCKGREQHILTDKIQQVNEKSHLFNRLWTQCQDCQGSLHQDVLCTSRDCPIFYKRVKVQKDLAVAQEMVDRFQQ